jgi:hypothetical protein
LTYGWDQLFENLFCDAMFRCGCDFYGYVILFMLYFSF